MSNLDSHGSFWIRVWAILGTAAVLITFIICMWSYHSDKQMLDRGFTKERVPRAYEEVWVQKK